MPERFVFSLFCEIKAPGGSGHRVDEFVTPREVLQDLGRKGFWGINGFGEFSYPNLMIYGALLGQVDDGAQGVFGGFGKHLRSIWGKLLHFYS